MLAKYFYTYNISCKTPTWIQYCTEERICEDFLDCVRFFSDIPLFQFDSKHAPAHHISDHHNLHGEQSRQLNLSAGVYILCETVTATYSWMVTMLWMSIFLYWTLSATMSRQCIYTLSRPGLHSKVYLSCKMTVEIFLFHFSFNSCFDVSFVIYISLQSNTCYIKNSLM